MKHARSKSYSISQKVENWKSFEKATFYIDPLTILIGANASGKSNLLDALLFLQRISSNINISQAINRDLNLPALRGAGWPGILSWPRYYRDKGVEKAVLGGFDPSARKYLKTDELTFTVPLSLYQKMLKALPESMFNKGNDWKNLMAVTP